MASITQLVRTPKLSLSHFLWVPRLKLGKLLGLPKQSLSRFLQLKLNVFLFRFLPFSISRWYIATLGKLYYLLNWQEKKLIRVGGTCLQGAAPGPGPQGENQGGLSGDFRPLP